MPRFACALFDLFALLRFCNFLKEYLRLVEPPFLGLDLHPTNEPVALATPLIVPAFLSSSFCLSNSLAPSVTSAFNFSIVLAASFSFASFSVFALSIASCNFFFSESFFSAFNFFWSSAQHHFFDSYFFNGTLLSAWIFHTASSYLLLNYLLSIHIIVHRWKYKPLWFLIFFDYWGGYERAIVIMTSRINNWELCRICFLWFMNVVGKRCQHLLVAQWILLDCILLLRLVKFEVFWLGDLRTPCIIVCFKLRFYTPT